MTTHAPSSEFQVRSALPEDIPVITDVINAAFAVESFFVRGDRISRDGVEKLFETGKLFVAESSDAVIAAAVYVEIRGDHGYFGVLSVAREHRGKGLGGRMINVAENYAREQGCRQMDLSLIDLRTELPPLYRKFGYEISGTSPASEELQQKATMPCHFIHMSKLL